MAPLSESLLERLKNRQAVLVAGLGCSELAVLPGWRALASALAERVQDEAEKQAITDLVQAGHLPAAIAVLRATLPEGELAEALLGLVPPRSQAPEALQALANAPWRGIITTGLDSVWTAALANAPDLAGRMVFAASAATLEAGRGRFLLQLLGRPDVPASLCLAPFEIAPKIGATGATKFLENLHKKWSFVFVGFSPGDPDLALLAGRILGASGSTLEHFFVAPGLTAIDERRVKAELGLTVVSVDGTLEETLKALARACESASDKPPADDVEAWLELLAAEPEDEAAEAMVDQGLAKLREGQEWERVVAALISRAELEHDPKDQAADLYEAGHVLHRDLSAPDRAYPVLLMALRLTPQDASLLSDAKQVADKAGQSAELLDELRQIEREAADSADLGAMRLAVAHMLADDPARQDEAIAAYRRLHDRDPGNLEVLSGLESLLRKSDRWDTLGTLYEKLIERDPGNAQAESKLEDVYQRTQKTPQLIELLQARLAKNPDDANTYARLAGLYEENQRWQPLAAMYERWLGKHPDDRDVQAKLEAIYHKTQQWQPLGALYERELAKSPDSVEALNKVEDLYRKSDQWRPLADLLERRAERRDPAGARAMRLERASILIDKLKDVEAALAVAKALAQSDPFTAEEIYAKCLDRDPGNAGALLGLSDLARDRGDHLRAAKFILDAVERTQNPLELGRLFTEAGSIHLDHLADEGKAIEYFERALAADPEQTAAAGRLLALREKAENWSAAEPLLDLLLRKTPDDGAGGKRDLYLRQVRLAHKLGKADKLAAALAAASKVDRQSASLAREYADSLFERKAWSEARDEYERARGLLDEHAPSDERARLCERLGVCSVQLNEHDAAVRHYEDALALEPDNRSTLEALIELRSTREEWKELIALKRRLVLLATADEDKARILDEIGDVLQEKLSDWPAAIKVYREALVAHPARRQTLYKTLDYHTQEKHWVAVVETLQKLAGLEDDRAGRAKLSYAMAAIYRDEIRDDDQAVATFEKVLDDDPLYPKAFEAIEKLLGEGKAWRALERAYREQLGRLHEDAPVELRLRLLDGSAETSLKLRDKESAAQAMEDAVALDRDNLTRLERLANLCFSMGPSAADKAVAQHQALLARKPDRIDSYKALAALFFQAGAHDKMWCVAGAMTCLGKADPPLRALYENFRPTQTGATPGKLTDELWQRIVHPDENPHLSALFALLSPALALSTAQPHKAVGLDRNARIDPASDVWAYAGALRYVASALDAPLPELYVKRDSPGTVTLVNAKDKSVAVPAFVVGLGFDQLSSQSQVVFDLAKRMVQLRPEHFPRCSLGTPSALDTAIRAALQLGGAPLDPGEHRDEVNKMAKQLDGLLAAELRTELKALARKCVDSCAGNVDIGKWIVASDLTASRAALAICGDIGAAARVLSLEPTGQSPMPVPERISDLLGYFVSEAHFAVRAALGLQVNLTPPSEPDSPHKRRMSHMQIKTEG
jgi:tetratricopeptide (TPR) repeat protein